MISSPKRLLVYRYMLLFSFAISTFCLLGMEKEEVLVNAQKDTTTLTFTGTDETLTINPTQFGLLQDTFQHFAEKGKLTNSMPDNITLESMKILKALDKKMKSDNAYTDFKTEFAQGIYNIPRDILIETTKKIYAENPPQWDSLMIAADHTGHAILLSICTYKYAQYLMKENFTSKTLPSILPNTDKRLAKIIIDLTLKKTTKTIKTNIQLEDETFNSLWFDAFISPTIQQNKTPGTSTIFINKKDQYTIFNPYYPGIRPYRSPARVLAYDSSPDSSLIAYVTETQLIYGPPPSYSFPHSLRIQNLENSTNHKIIFLNNTQFLLKLSAVPNNNPLTSDINDKLFLYTYSNTPPSFTSKKVAMGEIADPWAREYLTRTEDNIDTKCAYMAYVEADKKLFFNTNSLHASSIRSLPFTKYFQEKKSTTNSQKPIFTEEQLNTMHEFRKNDPGLWKCGCNPNDNTHFYLQRDPRGYVYSLHKVTFKPEKNLIALVDEINQIYSEEQNTVLYPTALYISHYTRNNSLSEKQLEEKMGPLYNFVSPRIKAKITEMNKPKNTNVTPSARPTTWYGHIQNSLSNYAQPYVTYIRNLGYKKTLGALGLGAIGLAIWSKLSPEQQNSTAWKAGIGAGTLGLGTAAYYYTIHKKNSTSPTGRQAPRN